MVACTCGAVFKNAREQQQHSMILAPYHKLEHPRHQIVRPETKEEGDKRFERNWRKIVGR